ncbi:exportin-4-like [Papaver somniferum]|uniref:exportin-4-like n=1 Tax=Papaver somniferum TaxID=3469 RepID=UPI000E706028|nr:exportin-4-like [Papaver somniferum]
MAHFHSTMQAIEQACTSIQMHINPALAEATILSLRQAPQPYQTCQYILENSQVANARFQAAGAIRDVGIREWGFLPDDDKRSLISFCLRFVMQHANSCEGYVLAKVSAVAAQFLKRGWLDFLVAEKEAFLFEVNQAVLGIHGVAAQFTGINFLESMVSEFSPSTSSAMGLPREFHEQCRASLEHDYLKKFYCWARDAALSVTNKVVEGDSSVPEIRVCSAALHLMYQVLNWDFQCDTNTAAAAKDRINIFSSRHEASMLKKSECVFVKPGPAWGDTLLSGGHASWLLCLYGTLRQKISSDRQWLDSPLAVSARKLIIQLCSLTGTIFQSDNGQMQEHHLLQMISGILEWIEPPDAVSLAIERGKSESEMLDGCRALLSVATLTTPMVFDKLLKCVRPYGTLSLLSSLTCEVFKARITSDTDDETWSWVARDILLDTWTALLEPTNISSDTALPPEGISAASAVFKLIVESELKVAATSAFDDEDVCDYLRASISAMDERLSSYALIARVALKDTVPLLTLLFSERITQIHQGRGTTDPTATLEELYSLLLIAGHVLADSGEGETLLVPDALQTCFMDVRETEHHPVVVLSGSIIKFSQLSLDPELRAAFFSPRLMEAVIWFLARWSDTYLMPLESGRGNNCNPADSEYQNGSQISRMALLNFCGEHDQGRAILDIIVHISMITLTSYPGENDLQALTCYYLLPALVRRKNVCVHLVTLDSWRNLAKAFANEESLFSLSGRNQRSLAESLIRSASGMRNSEESNQYVRDLMGQMIARLLDLSCKNDLKSIAQQPDVILLVSCLLDRLRGAAMATQPRSRKAIYEMGLSVMGPVLTLLESYKHESAVVYLLLKFVVSWVDGQVVFLEPKETVVVVDFCMRLLQLYSSHNIGKISLSVSSSLLSEAQTEKYKDLRALLQLITRLSSKDMIDFSSEPNEVDSPDIGQVIYLGLHIVTPLISLDLLKYPKLCHDYFALLSHMLEVYPEKVAQLNASAFAHIAGTLDFGLRQQDTEVVNMCLGALNGLASFHYKEINTGKEGLGLHAAGHTDPSRNSQEGVLSRFLQSLLQLLLFEDYSTELVSAAADALLPLILCEQGVYQRLGNELIERQSNPALISRLSNALQALTSSNQLSSSLDRINYQKFRKNVYNFLIEVRGFLRTM